MKDYRGMYKWYFDSKDKKSVPELAAALHDSVSSIIPGFWIKGYSGFIVYCDELLHELVDIRNKNLIIDRMSRKLPTVARRQFLTQAIIEEIHQTNEMENIHIGIRTESGAPSVFMASISRKRMKNSSSFY